MSIDAAFTQFPLLTTKRLRLRQIQLSDTGALFAIRSDPEVRAAYGQEPHQSLEETRRFAQHVQELYQKREAIFWGITFKDEDSVIGSCTFFPLDPESGYAEVGYELNRAYWGQGIMLEAVAALLTYGFTEMELHRIEAKVAGENTRSQNLLLKLGFTREGTLRQRYFFRDHFGDDYYFGLLEDEWQDEAKKRASS